MSRPLGRGIPRLQELSFLVVSHEAVAQNATFETIRQHLIEHMRVSRQSDSGSGNTARFQLARSDPNRYISNASESLKELMRLGFVVPATVPSDPKSAAYYRETTYSMTEWGERWAELLGSGRASALDHLYRRLHDVHPQFAGFMSVLARRPLVVPQATWTEFERTRDGYIKGLAGKAAAALVSEPSGWEADEASIGQALTAYITARLDSARSRQHLDPYGRSQDFVNACEEAMVKLAFDRAGHRIDYITHEVLRRWTKELQVANFSYHVPGPSALRLWATADPESDEDKDLHRRTADDFREAAIAALGEAYEAIRRTEQSYSPWVPVYQVRAAVTFKLRISERVFDRALTEFLLGERGSSQPYLVNLDSAQFGNVPPSERPFRVMTNRGPRDHYLMALVPRTERTSS